MFNKVCQHACDVAFIDGQIKLMKAMHVKSWTELVFRNFYCSVNRYFSMGIRTVVLAFDDYALVPMAKNMTQCKRKRHIPDVAVHRNETLPAEIPHNWQQCIMNRAFKTKVIQLVIDTLPGMLNLATGQSLIIDYKGVPVVHHANGTTESLPDEFAAMGEADVKFTRYTAFGSMLVDAIDGDYVPIALLHLQTLQQTKKDLPDISIYRMEIRCEKAIKRTAEGKPIFAYEYLHTNKLLRHLQDKVFIKLAAVWKPHFRGCEISIIATCIAFTGCDFTKGLPFIGAKKIWDNLANIYPNMLSALDHNCLVFDVPVIRDRVVALLYGLAYQRHFTQSLRLPMHEVVHHLCKRSTLSDMVKQKLPSVRSVECLARNASWVLAYWHCNANCPDPMQQGYGFTYNEKGVPIWEDEAQPPTTHPPTKKGTKKNNTTEPNKKKTKVDSSKRAKTIG